MFKDELLLSAFARLYVGIVMERIRVKRNKRLAVNERNLFDIVGLHCCFFSR
jgi:hypothetical protein